MCYLCFIHGIISKYYIDCKPYTDRVQAGFTENGISSDLHVGREVAILGISLYVLGLGETSSPHGNHYVCCHLIIFLHLGIGPLVIGPLSEVHGRRIIYIVAYLLFFAFSFAVAFAPDIGTNLPGTLQWHAINSLH